MERMISVIIPIYKGNRFIPQLAHMLEENWKYANEAETVGMEIVLVNDCPSEEVVIEEQWKKNLSWIKITNKENRGIHFSRVQGLLHSSGEYVMFLDQDDGISPIYIREQIAALGSADAVICNGKNLSDLIYRNAEEWKRAVDKGEYERGYNRIVSPGQVLLKKASIPEEWIGNILTKNGADDYFLWLLMFSRNKEMATHDKVLYWHYISDHNASKNTDEMDASVCEMASLVCKLGYLSVEQEEQIRQTRKPIESIEPELVSCEKYRKIKIYNQLLDMWMTLRDRKVSVKTFFEKMGIKRIAIYGGGFLGRHLYYELQGTAITVVCFLDRNPKAGIEGIKTIPSGEPVEDVDVIVITPVLEYEKIQKDLRQHYEYKMCSIESVLYNADCTLMME